MKLEEAIKILELHNKWRRDKTRLVEMQHPHDVGIAIDVVIEAAKDYLDILVGE